MRDCQLNRKLRRSFHIAGYVIICFQKLAALNLRNRLKTTTTAETKTSMNLQRPHHMLAHAMLQKDIVT